jgi:hypothetical protein
MSKKDDALTVDEQMQVCEHKEKQIDDGNWFAFPEQSQFCTSNFNGKQPSKSQLSRVWINRQDWKAVKPGREVKKIREGKWPVIEEASALRVTKVP